MPRRLRYSERKSISETGGLGPLEEEASRELRHALSYLVDEGENTKAGPIFRDTLRGECIKHFGWPAEIGVTAAILDGAGDDFLDLVEIIYETSSVKYRVFGPDVRVGRRTASRSGTKDQRPF